tara:strand:+ start:15818 stop:16948 length:1131 start_codon:yes stop_codon:yes gene_type:complete
MKNGEAAAAAELLKEKAFTDSKDQLPFLLDYSLAQQEAGNYQESNRGFQLAYDVAEWNDYHSISKIAGSLALNEGMMQYKGDEYEKLLIPVYAAKNFLFLKDYEAARVEVRRIHERINKIEMDGKKVFEQMPYAYYLSALIWEQNGDLDSAYIDYKNTYKYAPNFEEVKYDLLRMSKRLGRGADHAKYKKDFADIQEVEFSRKDGQVVVIYEQGRSPRKFPHPQWHRIPKLYPVDVTGVQARVTVLEKDLVKETSPVLDISTLAISSLEKQYAALIAKRVAGVATKAVLAKQIGKENEGLGQLAWVAMNIADQADLRQWLLLPSSIQVAKIYLPAGTYKLKIETLSNAQVPISPFKEVEVVVEPGKVSFIKHRSLK